MTHYLITGGAGFIGSNLTEALLKRGEQVTIIDDLSTGKLENITPFLDKITFVQASILDKDALARAMHGVDYVLHHAAIPSVPKSVKDPVTSHNSNITGTLNVLMAARDARVKRVVYAGSSSAYGDQDEEYKHEHMTPQPLSPYATQKLAGEYYMRNFWQLYGLETVTLRYFNVFGPKQDPTSPYSGVISVFITALLQGKIPTIYGDGSISRDFTFVENNIRANLLACTAQNVVGETINIACGTSITLNQLAQEINNILGTNIQPHHTEPRKGDIQHSKADITKARKLLGYEPTIHFAEGLKRTIEWYRKQSA